ncbi:SCN1B protein, partial [Amia calva]|nr:SCN1B protein [Amia calva]
QCWGGCVEVDSMTEAVVGQGFKLGCISCKRRGEVPAEAHVQWSYQAKGETEFTELYHYENMMPYNMHDQFKDRLAWNGSKNTVDLQDGSLYILNVSLNDSGVYLCQFYRTLLMSNHKYNVNASKLIELTVVEDANRELTSIISEIMMYVTIVGLQLWMIVILIYCYKKITSAGEEATKDGE